MILEKFLKASSLLPVMLVIFSSGVAYAQSNSNYAPPPMFDDMTPPMVRPQTQDGYIVEPKTSPNLPIPPSTIKPGQVPPAIITPRVSVDPDAQRPVVAPAAPVVPRTPSTPAISKPVVKEVYIPRVKPPIVKPVAKPTAQPVTAPLPVQKPVVETQTVKPAPAVPATPSASTPSLPTVSRDPKQSVITGPKTMPALPAADVDHQVTFDQKPVTGQTMLERHQQEVKAQKSETLTPIVPAPNPNVKPIEFDKGEQGALKKIIPFDVGQIGLAAADVDPIAAGVVKELDKEDKKDWRVQIKAYATPHGNGLSSDRRIALNRALSLRSTLIAQGVSASRIDVMAEGLQTNNSGPPDRIDLYLYGPPEE